jgi:hypothetical protein
MTTKADRARFHALQKIGCIACRQKGVFSQVHVHHLLSGGRRRGHQFTIPLCPYHHEGYPPDGISQAEANRYYGPSLARAPKSFRAEFGDDETLLATVDALLERVQ